MKFGMFTVPISVKYAEGQETAKEVIDWDLQQAEWADQAGIDEVYFAEHYTLGHEPSPSPDVMIAAASQRTNRIRLGAMAHLLPYHNPVALAFRTMWLDHMTDGRYLAGFAPGAYASDAQLFGTGSNNPRMLIEGLDIVDAIWTRKGPFTIEGEFWKVDMPAYDAAIAGPHLAPKQGPRPTVLMTGMSQGSKTLSEAGRRGYSPVSQQVRPDILLTHWETYADAAKSAGHTPDRSEWRIVHDFFVADTDDEARKLAVSSGLARVWEGYLIPSFKKLGIMPLLVGPGVAEEDVDIEYLVDNFFFVGSPETVASKVRELYEYTGGFGYLCFSGGPYQDAIPGYQRHLELTNGPLRELLSDLA
ncbi:LLM class flavin-dependent oxidoreductase [Mycolicibacterium sp. CBMA 226]|uniref:LLM class flavin-dependent oxidoreductase n=1 Tax=Mycolicibacterium sp. CBMA 226 TaxID=2606611 RepID=UPI0012DE1F3D|nr:LLM class flavin-dependent oxidoreductase [Mycolicibacterium sp. CBMA 226]MUL79033.1 LLM class flavin-dependent oxidoreductase [Mycolicibacterium sp. CBMA 226]QGW61355.1 2,5-diketocamphane 1,2-monooxygenase [Mycolicibacterium sp.]